MPLSTFLSSFFAVCLANAVAAPPDEKDAALRERAQDLKEMELAVEPFSIKGHKLSRRIPMKEAAQTGILLRVMAPPRLLRLLLLLLLSLFLMLVRLLMRMLVTGMRVLSLLLLLLLLLLLCFCGHEEAESSP